MIAFDPFQAYFGKDVDMHRANQTRPVLDALDNLCRTHNCTPLFIRHIGKSAREAIYAGLGSIDITGVMRSVLFLGQDPENENRRIIAHAKMNGGRIGQSLAYRMVSTNHDILTDNGTVTVEAPVLKWDGLSSLKANDLSMPPSTDTNNDRSLVDQAVDFLQELLSPSPILATEVQSESKNAGFTMATIRRAKAKMSVKVRRRQSESEEQASEGNSKQPWEWLLEPHAQVDEHAEDEHVAHLEHLGNKSISYKGDPHAHLADLEHLGNKSISYKDSLGI
jgi:hypothetical protein